MKEKEIVEIFSNYHLGLFSALIDKAPLRLYALEMPIMTSDGTKRIDMVLEYQTSDNTMQNQLLVLEFKRFKVDIGVCEQADRYRESVDRKLYRKIPTEVYLIGKLFSKYETECAHRMNFHCVSYDPITGFMKLL